MKINVIITAGGTSQRYGMENKLFAPCKDSCVVVESIKPFLTFEQVSKVIVAIHPSYSDELLNALEIAHIEDNRIALTQGGTTRTQTVKHGIRAIEDDCDYVIVHDGARPYVTTALINSVIAGAVENGVALPLLPLTDSLVCIRFGVDAVNRECKRPFAQKKK